MSRNILYAQEISTANKFIEDHSDDEELKTFLHCLRNSAATHSQKISICYNWLYENYKDLSEYITLSIGIVYWDED